MNVAESKAEVYYMALQSLTKAERKAVISRLLDDPALRGDILDLATFRDRESEPSRPFREYLAERRNSTSNR